MPKSFALASGLSAFFLLAGLVGTLAGVQTYALLLGVASAVLATTIAMRTKNGRGLAATLAAVVTAGFVLAYEEGTYLAYLSGWKGLEIGEFGPGEDGGNALRGQAWTLFISLYVGVPFGLGAGAVAWVLGRHGVFPVAGKQDL